MEIEIFYRTVSQILKAERAAKRMTLEETAKGICSLSYLSKIENCALVPDDVYVKALCERLELDADKLYQIKERANLEQLLDLYLFDQFEALEELYSNLEEAYHNAADVMLEVMMLMYKEEHLKAKRTIKNLTNITSTLSKNEFSVYMYLKLKNAILVHAYDELKDIVKFFTSHEYFCHSLRWLVYEALFMYGYYTDDRNLMEHYFYELHHTKQIGFPQQHLMPLQWMMLDHKAQFPFNDSVKKMEYFKYFQMDEGLFREYSFYKACVYIKNQLFVDAKDALEKLEYYSARELALLLYIASFLNDETYFKKVHQNIKQYSFSKKEIVHQKFIKFWLMLQREEHHHVIGETLKYDVLLYDALHPFPLYSKIYKEQLIQVAHRKMYSGEVKKYILDQ